MVIVAVAVAEVEKEGEAFPTVYRDKEASPTGGGHLYMKNEIFYVLSGMLIFFRSFLRVGQTWNQYPTRGGVPWDRGKEGGAEVMGSSTVIREGCTRWGAASWRRKD